MTSKARAHIHNLDAKWMEWLRLCSALKGQSGQTLLKEYATDKQAWLESHSAMRSKRYNEWPFCRGHLSISEIAAARSRYLDKYVFVAGEHDARPYIEALLVTEEAQIRLRLDGCGVKCPGCADRDATIASLRMALSVRQVHTDHDIQVATVSSVFHRYFMLSENTTCSRTEVRKCIESVLQQELGTGVRLPSHSTVWNTFLREKMAISAGMSCPIRCQFRKHPISRAVFEAEQADS